MAKADIAMVGLGVMGQNLALNMASKGFSVVGYDYLPEKTDKFIAERASGKNIMRTAWKNSPSRSQVPGRS